MLTKNGIKVAAILILALLLQQMAFASEVVELPPEELARESVLPVFDHAVSVKNRNVVTAKKFDVNLFYGYAMTEPIANVSKMGLGVYYNYNENHAFGLFFANNLTGLSDYARQIENTPATHLDLTKAPMPKNTVMADYNLKAFYGKMSISKSLVFNTIIYGSGSVGAIQYDNKTYPAVALGIGQKFYFNRHWALRFDLRLYANQGPVPFLGGSKMQVGTARPSYDEFQERVLFTTNLDAGLSYLF
ncbi:MAG: outer membrane beta-barrel domain-containing protein [Pseudobdellovibrionaceae bacterium]